MRFLRVAACVLLPAGLALAQARGSPAPGQPLGVDRLAMVAQVLQAARQSAEAAPAWAAPQLLIAVARAELPQFREQSLADDRAAFQLALALPTPDSLDTAGAQAREQIKQNAELEAVSAVARDSSATGKSAPGPASIDAAVALLRMADVPKAPLYDQLLLAAHMPSATAQALVRDCELSGEYPYRGAAAWLARKQLHGFDRIAFVRDSYAHAGDETDPSSMSAAVLLLQVGHRVAPELDGALETASTALLRRIGQNENVDVSAPGYAMQQGAAIRLQALLRQIDPAQAARLAADYPNLAAATPGAGGAAYMVRAISSGSVAIAFQPQSLAAGAGATAAEPAPADAAFQALVMRAERDERKNPDAALAEANQAADLLDTELSAAEAPAAARLALVYAAVGDSADAAKLMSACLDAAGRAASQADANFDQAGADAQAEQALHLEAENWQVTAIYGAAAQLDFITTVQRAESANFTLDKPLVLARIALMSELSRAH